MEERKRDVRMRSPRHPEREEQMQHVVDEIDEIRRGVIDGDGDGDDDDDARSIRTIIPHELERVDEEDEDQLAADEEEEEEDRRRRREELGRPRTPEPTGMGMVIAMTEEDYVPRHSSRHSPSPPNLNVIDELNQRMNTLSDQLESALELSNTLQAQHAAAQGTISALESKVSALESLVHVTQSQIQIQAQEKEKEEKKEQPQEREESLTAILNEWKKGVEGQWSIVKEEWGQERERLNRAREEWEGRVKSVEVGLGSAMGKIDNLSLQQRPLVNGDIKHMHGGGLVTPPSPRSLSADSNRPRQRKRRSGSSRGRSRSRSQSMPHMDTADSEGSCESSVGGSIPSTDGFMPTSMLFNSSGGAVRKHGFPPEVSDPTYLEMLEEKMKITMKAAARSLATPDPSIQLSSSIATIESSKPDSDSGQGGLAESVRMFLFVDG